MVDDVTTAIVVVICSFLLLFFMKRALEAEKKALLLEAEKKTLLLEAENKTLKADKKVLVLQLKASEMQHTIEVLQHENRTTTSSQKRQGSSPTTSEMIGDLKETNGKWREKYLQVKEEKLDLQEKLLDAKSSSVEEQERIAELCRKRASIYHIGNSPTTAELIANTDMDDTDRWWESPPDNAEPQTVTFHAFVEEKDELKPTGNGPHSHTPFVFQDANTKEEAVEKNFHRVFENAFTKASSLGVHWWDGHTTKWLHRLRLAQHGKGLSPDAVACCGQLKPGTKAPRPQDVMAVHDNKRRRPNGCFTPDDKAKLLIYCSRVLDYQPGRQWIGGSLFDGQYAQCFQVFHFRMTCGPVLDCSKSTDAQAFANYLRNPAAMGWPRRVSDCKDLLGSGATGFVFESCASEDAVIKVAAQNESYIEHERNILSLLQSYNFDSPGFVRLHAQQPVESHALALRPRCTPLDMDSRIQVSKFAPLIKRLGKLHECKVVHCDVRPENIMLSPDGELILCDFGAAQQSNQARRFTHGTLFFAASDVLDAFASDKPFVPLPRHDISALVRCAYVYNQLKKVEYHTAIEVCNFYRRQKKHKKYVQKVKKFWEEQLNSAISYWRKAIAAADADDTGGVLEFLQLMFEWDAVKEQAVAKDAVSDE